MGRRILCKMETSQPEKRQSKQTDPDYSPSTSGAKRGLDKNTMNDDSSRRFSHSNNLDIGTTDNTSEKSDWQEGEEYLRKHKISDVLSILTSSLVYARPFNSRRYMSAYLKELKDVRDSYSENRNKLVPHGPEHPLFTENTLTTIFNTADFLESGIIDAETASKLCGILGFDTPVTLFDHCDNVVTKKFFVQTVHEALLLKTAAFYDVKEKYRNHL